MKRLSILLCILFILSFAAGCAEQGVSEKYNSVDGATAFDVTAADISRETVIVYENSQPEQYDSANEVLNYPKEVFGYKASLNYEFDGDRFKNYNYKFLNLSLTEGKELYSKIREGLIKKYGEEPQFDDDYEDAKTIIFRLPDTDITASFAFYPGMNITIVTLQVTPL